MYLGQTATPVLNAIPSDAVLTFWSTRSVVGRPDVPSLGPAEIYVMNQNGIVTQITENNLQSYEHVAISFDKTLIACDRYLANGAGNAGLWVLDTINKTETRLVPDFYSAGNGGVDWSSDGWIYFSGKPTVDGFRDIYKIRPDGSGLTKVTSASTIDPGEHFDVGVGEDNKKISFVKMVFVTINGVSGPKTQIWTADIDGNNQQMAFDGGPIIGMQGGFPNGGYDPELSPDSTQVVFSHTNTDFINFVSSLDMAHDLWIANLDGTNLRRITQPGPIYVIPDWHGDKILATEYNEAENFVGLVTFNPDGTGKTRLETNLPKVWDGGQNGKFIGAMPPVATIPGSVVPVSSTPVVPPTQTQPTQQTPATPGLAILGLAAAWFLYNR